MLALQDDSIARDHAGPGEADTVKRQTLTLLMTLLAVALLSSACTRMRTAIDDDKRSMRYDETIKAYMSAIRWGYYDVAEGFIRYRDEQPSVAESTPDLDYDFLEGVRVSQYLLRTQRPTGTPDEMEVTVSWSFYHTDYGTVNTFVDRQLWWYQKDENSWYLEGNLPDFKGALLSKAH